MKDAQPEFRVKNFTELCDEDEGGGDHHVVL